MVEVTSRLVVDILEGKSLDRYSVKLKNALELNPIRANFYGGIFLRGIYILQVNYSVGKGGDVSIGGIGP